MVNDKITLNFRIEKGESIDQLPNHFFARIGLTSESKNLLREKLGSSIQLDNYLDLDPENFYVSYNQYYGGGRNQLNIRDDNSRFLTSNLPLDHYGFSVELSSDGPSIADYGFYPLAVIYNPNHYDKTKEKVFEDHGKLLPTVSNILDKLLSNANNLTTQDVLQNVFSQLQKEAAEEVERLAKEREAERQREKELNEKNEELKELIEKDEIKIFKVIKGHDIGNGRLAVILQLDGKGDKIVLDSNKYYIAEYKHDPECEGYEYLHFVRPGSDMLVDYENLFFVLNQSSYPGFESGFYSEDRTDPHNYAKYSKDQYLGGDQLSEKLSNGLEEDSDQMGIEVILNDESANKGDTTKSEIKFSRERAVGKDNYDIEGSVNTHVGIDDGHTFVPNPENEDTELHIAVYNNDLEKAKLLIEEGADVNIQNRLHHTPLSTAFNFRQIEMLKILFESSSFRNDASSFKKAIRAKSIELVERLINKDMDINLNSGEESFVHIAGRNADPEMVLYLISKGANFTDFDLGFADKYGNTPLHLIAERRDFNMAKLLIDKGASLCTKNKSGETPLACAIKSGNTDTIEYMSNAISRVLNNEIDQRQVILFKLVKIDNEHSSITLKLSDKSKSAFFFNKGEDVIINMPANGLFINDDQALCARLPKFFNQPSLIWENIDDVFFVVNLSPYNTKSNLETGLYKVPNSNSYSDFS